MSNLVINPESVLKIIKTLKEAASIRLNLTHYSKEANDTALRYISIGKQIAKDVIQGNYSHKNAFLEIEMKVPTIFMPLNINSLADNILIVDLGIVNVNSDLQTIKENVDYSESTDIKIQYDTYSLQCHNF